MPAIARPVHLLVAFSVGAGALLGAAPAPAATKAKTKTTKTTKKAKRVTYPSIAKVVPSAVGVGDTLTLSGRNFRPGKGKNTVVFKRTGKRALFVKAGKATGSRITVVVPAKVLPMLAQKQGKAVPTRFRLNVLTTRFGRAYTPVKRSPLIGPASLKPAGNPNDCDGDGTLNAKDTDDDNDLLADTLEATLQTDACKRDSDGDGMSDGWEYQSALDRNNGSAGASRPFPSAKPYPNPLFADKPDVDHDGDGLTDVQEYAAWATFGANRVPLSYSGGNPASAGRQAPPGGLEFADRDGNGFLTDFERDADGDGIPNMDEGGVSKDEAAILDITQKVAPDAVLDERYRDYGIFGDQYIAKAAEFSHTESRCAGINQVPFYCTDLLKPTSISTQKVDSLDWLATDSDGDGVKDGQDDADHDGVDNLTEYLREIRAPYRERHWGPIDACYPNSDSFFCLLGSIDIDHDGIDNRQDLDDDGDGLTDDFENAYHLDPLVADTDADGVSDGFEVRSALDLNSAAAPYPGKRPYPNPLDDKDANVDFDGDGLTLRDEFRAWVATGAPATLSYSDGSQYTGGKLPVTSPTALLDTDLNGYLSDDERDLDSDGLGNWDELHGRMTPQWWAVAYDGTNGLLEAQYPNRQYAATNFADPDTDGDGILDGADDEDHDGFTNAVEARRPLNWGTTYVSTLHPGSNPKARTNPFNPCKPYYSDLCHTHPPFGYYQQTDDWESPVHANGP